MIVVHVGEFYEISNILTKINYIFRELKFFLHILVINKNLKINIFS